MSTWDLDNAIRELRTELRQELRAEVRRSRDQDRGLLEWTDIWPVLLPLGPLWLMMIVLLADRT